ncbi:hypothetical protein FOH10_04255 [Nocardia otitidiscaviarum]|uniref:Uncharacterized protein n=1 Tax=Nocardia otitidiscaviarum TaxID=1823 RepID=A0A516NGM9_9NOCA|nr:hypothetical protein [Nocardia otitidiscaviarum]MCP9625434.1 hypothetical protein [Nocardia otitidiscaviarum]QDP78064.1 hypothetical protein FOH10_04255 [Nocardia otitidiscaviarum]
MGFWDGVGDFFSEYGDDILVGAAGVGGFLIAGPAGAALLGGAASGLNSWRQGNSFGEVIGDAALGGTLGLIGGGIGSLGFRGALSVAGGKAVGASIKEGGKGLFTNGFRGALPGAWNGARTGLNVGTGRFIMGGLGSGAGTWGGMNARENYGALQAGGAAGPVPTMDYTSKLIRDGRLTVDSAYTAHVHGPDRSSANWPDGLELLSTGGEKNYEDFTESVYTSWEMFGRGDTEDAPASPRVEQTSGEDSAAIISYVSSAKELKTKYDDLLAADAALGLTEEEKSILLEEVARISKTSRTQVESAVAGLRDFATVNPMNVEQLSLLISQGAIERATGPMEEDEFVSQLIDTHLALITGIMDAATGELQTLATEVERLTADDPGADDKKDEGEGDGDKSDGDESGNGNDTPYPYPYPYPNPNQYQNGGTTGSQFRPIDFGLNGTPTAIRDASRSSGADNPSAIREGVGGDDRTPAEAPPPRSTTSPTSSPTPVSSPTPTAAPSTGTGLDPLLLSSLLNQKQREEPTEGDEERERRDSDPGPEQPGIVQSGPAAPPTSTTGQQPATTTANTPATNTPATNTSATTPRTQVSSSQPMLRPNTDKPMVYTFPDGRTQEVSAVVYAALDAAFDNAATTDARAAYESAAVALNEQRLGAPVDPYQLITGDVARWDQRTALVVAFDTESSGTLEVIVAGELLSFSAEMRDNQGDFGPFAGFFHPPGIDVSGSTDRAAGTAPEADTAAVASVPA